MLNTTLGFRSLYARDSHLQMPGRYALKSFTSLHRNCCVKNMRFTRNPRQSSAMSAGRGNMSTAIEKSTARPRNEARPESRLKAQSKQQTVRKNTKHPTVRSSLLRQG